MKKFTCLMDDGKKVGGVGVGTKEEILAWMETNFKGVHKYNPSEDEQVMPAWVFFYEGDTEEYETTDGKKLYLAEILDHKGVDA